MSNGTDQELLRSFFVESLDIIENIESNIVLIKESGGKKELIDAVFRGLHTIKGNSSFLDLQAITRVSHAAEGLLDKARKDQIKISLDLVSVLEEAVSTLSQMLNEQDTDKNVDTLIERIDEVASGKKVSLSKKSITTPSAVDSTKKVQIASYIRVDENKMMKIISIANEFEILRHAMEKIPDKIGSASEDANDIRFDMDIQLSKLSHLSRSLSSLVFGVRLVPVNNVFKRFPSVVRDLAEKLNKKIELKIANGDAELDKSIVEAITDPMTHLIRNAADHGIETIEERRQKNKPLVGKIILNSYVKGNFIYIDISDDGRGIDSEKILQKAIEKGIVPREKAPTFSEAQKLALIFAPGFSTADEVSDISGRGVGMDVVKSNINKLKGTVIINSIVGEGTTIQLRFPMSMAVMFSLFTLVHGVSCAFPVDQIDESIDYFPHELMQKAPEEANMDGFYSVFSLKSLLWGIQEDILSFKRFHMLRFKGEGGKSFLFIVDEFSSIEEAVVQSVDSYISALPGIQGASIQKDGSVAVMLNTQAIIDLAKKAKPLAVVRVKDKASDAEEPNLSDYLGYAG